MIKCDITCKQKLSNTFSTARIYALISIVCAHIYFANGVVATVFDRVGNIGVIVFLIMSGYFYRTDRFGSFFAMIKKKFISVVVPWLILGTFTWLYNFILSKNYSGCVLRYINWIIGNGSYLYYLTVLFMCFLIFYKHNITMLFIAIIINIISVIITAMGLLSGVMEKIGINNYLNVFNWIGFFAIGMSIQLVKEQNLLAFILKFRWVGIIAFNIVLILLVIFNQTQVSYFSIIAIPYELLGAFAVIAVSTFNLTKFKLFKNVSNYSFTIYLLHMIIIALLDNFFALSQITMILSPMIIIVVCLAVLFILKYFAKKVKLQKLFCIVMGIRQSK